MSNLKILVCTLLFAVTSGIASSAVADHGWPSNYSSGCSRSGGYSNNSNTLYRPLAESHGYSTNHGYGVRSPPLNYHNSHRVGSDPGFRNGNHGQNRPFDPRLGANSVRSPNAWRSGSVVYDSVHEDYHTVPGGVLQQYHENFSGGARNHYQNNSSWFGSDSGR